MAALFSSRGRLMLWGRVILGALLSDKVGLGPGRRGKKGPGASQGILARQLCPLPG